MAEEIARLELLIYLAFIIVLLSIYRIKLLNV